MLSLSRQLTSHSVNFRLPRLTWVGIPFIILVIVGFFGIRSAELLVTFRPLPYAMDRPANWVLPPKTEDVWFTAQDGVRLHGWFIHSRKESVEATILYCHGKSGNLTHVSQQAQQLAEEGFDVLIFDYRCYGRSEWKLPDEQGINHDTAAAYRYLVQERGVEPKRMVIYGWSLGTAAAVDLASRQACGALVLEAPLSSASDMANIVLPLLPKQLHWVGKNRFESARKISQVKCPVLVMHGEADKTIPPEQGRKVFAAANEPKQLLIVPNGTHWVSKVNAYLDSVADFILTTLGRTIKPGEDCK